MARVYGSMPGSLPNSRAYRDSPLIGKLTDTRGWRMPYPSTTRCLLSSYRARFSGCAMAATHCQAESRGSCVSVSRVMTYFTLDRISVAPTTSAKQSFEEPRRNEFRSESFPRLRS